MPEVTEKAPEEPAPEPEVVYSDQPGAGPPGSPNAPAEEAPTSSETPASAPEATDAAVEKGTAKKGA